MTNPSAKNCLIYSLGRNMTDYTVISRFRNKEQCEFLVNALLKKGKTCYNFCKTPADPLNAEAAPENQMKALEVTENFFDNAHFRKVFQQDLEGLKNARKVILLLPAGISFHIEAGIAYGLGKRLILIGEPEKPERPVSYFSRTL